MFNIIENENEKIYLIKDSDIYNNIRLFELEIETFIKNDNRNLVFDMVHLGSVDSMFLSAILRFRTKLSLGGRNLLMTNYNEHIRRCVRLLNLEDHLL
jgi:anti-anti-sigma regulatory factor